MKTIEEIQKERTDLIQDGKTLHDKRLRNRNGKRVVFLKDCLVYLESQPREDFIKKSLDRLKQTKKSIDSKFSEWAGHLEFPEKSMASRKSMYRTETGWKKIVKQISNLEYILQ